MALIPGDTPVRAGSLRAWAVALRPASLPLALGPVLVGAAVAYLRTGDIPLALAGMAALCALLMQAITNLQNDIGFTVRGCEKVGARVGLPRATAQGWLSRRAVRRAIVVLCLLATALGLALVYYRGWPVLAIGICSLVAALAYMGGPKPIAYTPFGELTVFVFFGLVAVMGTDWLLTNTVGATSAMAGAAVGSLAAAALAVNNHRDAQHDQLVGRKTFVVLFGRSASVVLFGGLLVFPLLMCLALAWVYLQPVLMAPLVLLPVVWPLLNDFRQCPGGLAYNAILFRVFRLEFWFAALLATASILVRSF